MSDNSPALEDRAISVWSKRKQLHLHAQRALLSATADLTVCCLASLGRLHERFCKETLAPLPPTHHSPPMTAEKRPTTVRGRYPNHLWILDITCIPLVFPFLCLHLAVVLDAYSRMPLAARVFLFEPSAKAMLALVLQAIARHGKPRHFVSDQGDQFTAGLFRAALKAMGIRQRFGALYQHGSIALMERFWKSLKTDLRLRSSRPWSAQDFEQRLGPALVHYSYCRPHSALDGRVPAEVYFGLPDLRPLMNSTPRGRPDDPERECPVEIVFLHPENRALLILVPKAA